MRKRLAFLLNFQFGVLLDELLIKFRVYIDARQGCLLWKYSSLHFKLLLQLSHKVCSVHASIGWYLLFSSLVVFSDFFTNYRLCLSFWDEIHGMNGGTFGLWLLRILYLCLLRTFLSRGHSLLLRVDLFLRFWFRLRVINFGLLGKIVQIEKLLACLCLSAKNFPQCLLFSKLLGVNFCFHEQLILLYNSKRKQKNQRICKECFNFFKQHEDNHHKFLWKINQKKQSFIGLKNLMFATNNLSITLHGIQNDLTQLQNHLLKFKLITSQASCTSLISQSDLHTKISSQLEVIQITINSFCNKYEQQIKNLQNKLNLLSNVSNRFSQRIQWGQDQKYLLFTEKINMLQRSLKKTQQNQTKLIDTINIFIAKYHIHEQPTLIKNDQQLKSKIKTSQTSSLISFQPCTGIFRQASLQKFQNSRETLRKTTKKSEESIYLQNNHSNHCLNVKSNESLQYIRNNFSKQGNNTKISLKQTSGMYHPVQFPNSNRKTSNNSIDSNNRPGSLEEHEHRFKFMMDNLYY